MADQPKKDSLQSNAPQEANKPDAAPVKAAEKTSAPAESAASDIKPVESQQQAVPPAPAEEAKPAAKTDSTAAPADQKAAPALESKPVAKTEPTPAPEAKVAAAEAVAPAAEAKTNGKTEAAPPAQAPAAELPINVNLAFVIDDEPANRDFLERLINQAEYETIVASSGKEAIEVANALPAAPAIIAVDSELPDIKGIQLVKQFRVQFPKSKIVMATMHDDLNTITEAFKYGCDVFLVKPHGFMELFKRLKTVKTDPSVLENLIFDSHGVRHRR